MKPEPGWMALCGVHEKQSLSALVTWELARMSDLRKECREAHASLSLLRQPGISPSSNKTPQAVIDKAKQENASKGGRAESSPIVLQAGSTATIMGYSAEAGTTSSFGIYQPEERTLTGDTNHAIGQTWTVGPFSEDKNLAFWFQSGVSPPDSKIQLTPSGEGVYYVGCEDLTDNDYNDFVAQVTIKCTAKIVIENAKATPEEFTPSKKGENNTTKLTAQIIANNGFQADSIQWQVTVENETGAVVKTFDTKTGSLGSGPWDVSETWDGKIRKNEFVPYGNYKFKIKATATSSANTVDAEATGIVKVEEPLPKLVKIEFQDSLNLQTDEGEKIKPIYYEQKGDEIIENPVAVTTDSFMEPAMAMRLLSEKAQLQIFNGRARVGQYEYKATTLTFKRPEGLTDNTTVYEFELKDTNGQKIYSVPSELSFSSGGEKEKLDVVLVYEHRITRINGLNVDLRRKDTIEWHTIAKPRETIYEGLGSYKEPFIKGSDKRGPTLGLKDIAHYLGNGAATEQEAREMMLQRLCLGEGVKTSWLKQKHFIYNTKMTQFSIRGNDNNPTGGNFNYNLFMDNYGQEDWENNPWQGDCEDISAFYALCCSVVGVDMNLARILSKRDNGTLLGFTTFSVKSSAFKVRTNPGSPPGQAPIVIDPTFGIQTFQLHQTAQLSNQVWDPCLIFNSEFNPMLAIKIDKAVYDNAWLINTMPFMPAYSKPEFSLTNVTLPAYAPSLEQ